MTRPLIVVDADVLGRRRTGDETYVENLLRALPRVAPDLRFAAVTRHPELVPDGVEPVTVEARSQELRMAWSLPRLLRSIRPALAHFQHALPLRCPVPAVVTVHDVSFARAGDFMPRRDRIVFRWAVPRAARSARRVLAVSERTKHDLVALYGIPPERIVVTRHGVDPAFAPADGEARDYLLFVGAVHARKAPLIAADAARAVGRTLVVVGPEVDRELADQLRRLGADVRGYVPKEELAALYRRAAALLLPSRFEGFGLPALEAMASGTPVVATPDRALQEVADGAAVFAEPARFAEGVERALRERDRLAAAGIERARAFTWDDAARRTAAAYRDALTDS